MGLFSETISCPNCGSLCTIPKRGNIFLYILYLIIIIVLGVTTFGIGIICLLIWLAINKGQKNKPVECPRCGFRFIP
jgi:DNA-directed RNA polymerase subunit RPC12/RpoP